MDDERDRVRADIAMIKQTQEEDRKTDAQRAKQAGLPKPPKPLEKPPKGTPAPKTKAAPIYGPPVETELKELRKAREPAVRVRGDRERKVTIPQTSDAGISRFATREEQQEDVLRRTYEESKGTFNQKQLFAEAEKQKGGEEEGRSAEFPITAAASNNSCACCHYPALA